MKTLFLLLIATSIAVLSFGQQEFTITGKVTDSTGTQPLAGASVFCQNTTFGTISNAEGTFKKILPAGGYDLVISYTGYETQVIRISNTNTAALAIQLKQKEKSLQEVAVTGSAEVPDGFKKYGQFFFDNFIGSTANAAQCTIQNPEVLQFYFYKKRNRLKVKAKEDLIIVNNALGYKIKFQLDSFAYEYNTDISTYSGFPFFEQMQGTAEQQNTWKQNREVAYTGSRLHFVRSWYDSTLADEGFVIEKVDPDSKTLKTYPIDDPYDSTFYHVVENNDVEISYNGKLRIIYKNELPDPKYLSVNKLPAHLRGEITIIDINEGFIIQQNGYFYEQNDVTNNGYWSWEKMAEALPYDYDPE